MYTNISYFKKKLRGLSIRVFNLIENNNNTKFETNGEAYFINNIFKEFSAKKNDLVIFDIGANIGTYTNLMLESAKKFNVNPIIHIFEPVKSCFEKLYNNYSNNNFLHLNNFGASDNNKSAEIYYDKDGSSLASLYNRNLKSNGIELNITEEITLKRLDDYIIKKNIKHIDFIKIDIEGHEIQALKGLGKYLSSDFIDYIQLEYGGANLDSKSSLMEIYQFLEERGFYIAKMLSNGLEIREYKPFMENFSYSNYVAISNKVLEK